MPTRLWGFSGHVQTILHSLIGRVRCPWPIGGRISLVLPDKSTLTYDLYEPVGSEHEGKSTYLLYPFFFMGLTWIAMEEKLWFS